MGRAAPQPGALGDAIPRTSSVAKPFRPVHLRYRAAFLGIAAMVLAILLSLPFAVRNVVQDLLAPPADAIYPLPLAAGEPATPAHSHLHVAMVGLDELHLRATLRVSGHQVCSAPCPGYHAVVFFSLNTDEAATAGMPPSARVDLPPAAILTSETFELPVSGYPNRYPFDAYTLQLAVGMARVAADGTAQPLARADAAGQLALTLQEQLPRQEMRHPVALDAAAADTAEGQDVPYQFLLVRQLTFERPLHIRILAVLLVLLIGAAAAYAVFMRPLHELVLYTGGLVLGVRGVRSILLPGNPNYLTAVDLVLSIVILFLLGTITVRALQFCYQRSGWPGAAPGQGE
jgi:hypothetical protein